MLQPVWPAIRANARGCVKGYGDNQRVRVTGLTGTTRSFRRCRSGALARTVLGAPSVVLHPICDLKTRLFRRLRVANARNSVAIVLHLDSTKNPSFLLVASRVKHYTSISTHKLRYIMSSHFFICYLPSERPDNTFFIRVSAVLPRIDFGNDGFTIWPTSI